MSEENQGNLLLRCSHGVWIHLASTPKLAIGSSSASWSSAAEGNLWVSNVTKHMAMLSLVKHGRAHGVDEVMLLLGKLEGSCIVKRIWEIVFHLFNIGTYMIATYYSCLETNWLSEHQTKLS